MKKYAKILMIKGEKIKLSVSFLLRDIVRNYYLFCSTTLLIFISNVDSWYFYIFFSHFHGFLHNSSENSWKNVSTLLRNFVFKSNPSRQKDLRFCTKIAKITLDIVWFDHTSYCKYSYNKSIKIRKPKTTLWFESKK